MARTHPRAVPPEVRPPEPRVYRAVVTFYAGGVLVNAGDTVVAGHPLLAGRRGMFRPFVPTWTLPGEALEAEPEPETPEGAA